jgi:photosynthesis system II assembly factor YCF48-like protein
MNSCHREVLVLFLVTIILMGSCAPAPSLPRSSPADTIAPTSGYPPGIATATEPQAPFGVTLPPPPPDYLEQIFMMDATSGWAWAIHRAQGNFFTHTSDGGQTWTRLRLQQYISPASPPYLICPLDAQTAWVVLGDDRLLRTSDGGQTWEIVNQNLPAAFVVPFHDWYFLRFADATHGWLEAGYAAAGTHEFYYETPDGGASWHPWNFASWPADIYPRPDYPNELYGGPNIDAIYYDFTRFIIAPSDQEGTLKMFLSADRGKSWKTVELLPSAFPGQSFKPLDRKISQPIFFDPHNGVVTVSILDRTTNTTQLFVYGTSDGGLTWTLTGGPSVINDLHSDVSFLSPHDGVLICGNKFCTTDDSGRTWRAFAFGAPPATDTVDTNYQLDFVDPTTGWLLEKAFIHQAERPKIHLFKTTDGGLTWTELAPMINP